ncbi:23S rRNA (uracil(1939)-C(5))-methyltransferase RlmD [Neisseria weaveri]|uniref:23S rRNA (uracil(1939)-C(5))-methyltransferase RlmD n=1 Tax=Neisseria weaveri TaxID=28091 RepID=UPI000D305EB9|nr:23S rRNA (uracil(1939)-C(5))-methyltransferase RlmD [Neisseria weaveri]
MSVEDELRTADVVSIDYEGRGIARLDGKTVFIKGALPSEKVVCRITQRKKQFDEAVVEKVLVPSPERVKPFCRYFDTCGGCALQHASDEAQVAYKQRVMEEQLLRIGKVFPEQILPPIYGFSRHYRSRCRLAVRVGKENQLTLGFQAKKSHDVVDVGSCIVLPKHISKSLHDVKMVLQFMVNLKTLITFIEFLDGDNLTVLNISVKQRPSEKSLSVLKTFTDEINRQNGKKWQVWLQIGNNPSEPFYPSRMPDLDYSLPEFDVVMPYRPGDFTQNNPHTNALMVSRAVKLLDIRPGERVADLFCGLGNFSLPLARYAAQVVGIEGADYLVKRAVENAKRNRCSSNTQFLKADLFEITEKDIAAWGKFDKMLLDPPRSGAFAVVNALHAPYLPQRIVCISCNPGTFARDAAVLVGKGYSFKGAGIMNLFAQTAHVESIGWFELQH